MITLTKQTDFTLVERMLYTVCHYIMSHIDLIDGLDKVIDVVQAW
jgi:hypothetical protein